MSEDSDAVGRSDGAAQGAVGDGRPPPGAGPYYASATIRPPEEWCDAALGVSKHLLDFQFVAMDRPTDLDECDVVVTERNAECAARHSEWLRGDDGGDAIRVRLRTARTEFDCVLGIVLQQMMPGERSRVNIATRGQVLLELTLQLQRICPVAGGNKRHLHQLTSAELVDWAGEQKANGVALFRRKEMCMAQYAFARAAKALVSLKPFDKTADKAAAELITAGTKTQIAKEWQLLYESVCVNLAACLLRQQRWEDVLYVLQDATKRGTIDAPGIPDPRAIYRRAVAHFNLRQLDEARIQIERMKWQSNAELKLLRDAIVREQNAYASRYSNMVRKMFQN